MIKLNKKCREYSVFEADFHKYRETIGELISEKDEKTAALDGKVKNLEKTVRELVAKLAKKCKEKNVLEKEFQNFKEYSYEVISKGDEKIEKMQSIIAVDQLFDIVNLAERYQLPTLMKELEAQMQIIEVKSIDNMMELASTACKFSQFENVSRALLLNCAKFAEKNMWRFDQRSQFMLDQHAQGNGVVAEKLKSLWAPVELCEHCELDDCDNWRSCCKYCTHTDVHTRK